MVKKEYIDIASIVACFFVLWDHVNGRFFQFDPGITWIISAVIHIAVNPAVPLFAMVTGAVLIDYREKYTTKTFFRKRFNTVVVPFLFWSVFYMVIQIITGNYTFGIKSAISGIMDNKFNQIFWFFFPLFGAYLAIPVISTIEKAKRQLVFRYCILGYFILGVILPWLFNKTGISYNAELKFNIVNGFLEYVLIGYYIDNYVIPKRERMIIYIAGIACFAYNSADCVIRSFAAGKLEQSFTGCFSMTYMVTGTAMFLFVKYMKPAKNKMLKKLIQKLRPLTFGIYLVQMAVLMIVQKIPGISTDSIIYITCGVIPVFIICAALCSVMLKIPVLRNLI